MPPPPPPPSRAKNEDMTQSIYTQFTEPSTHPTGKRNPEEEWRKELGRQPGTARSRAHQHCRVAQPTAAGRKLVKIHSAELHPGTECIIVDFWFSGSDF